jgi:hypothetical protein
LQKMCFFSGRFGPFFALETGIARAQTAVLLTRRAGRRRKAMAFTKSHSSRSRGPMESFVWALPL